MKTNTQHGGTRPGAGRPRKGEALRESISFSVDPEIKRLARELRGNGCDLNSVVEAAIRNQHREVFAFTE